MTSLASKKRRGRLFVYFFLCFVDTEREKDLILRLVLFKVKCTDRILCWLLMLVL